MKEKIKDVLVILFLILACIALGAQIITDCQKAILQNSLSETINHQNEINDKLSEILENNY